MGTGGKDMSRILNGREALLGGLSSVPSRNTELEKDFVVDIEMQLLHLLKDVTNTFILSNSNLPILVDMPC